MSDLRPRPSFFLPPYLLEALARSDNTKLRAMAQKTLHFTNTFHDHSRHGHAPHGPAHLQPPQGATGAGGKHRIVLDLGHQEDIMFGQRVRVEGDAPANDVPADEAYDYSGVVYDFYEQVFGRESLDGARMPVVSCVHFGQDFSNAFWTGDRMVYGDGDGQYFNRFTASLSVIAHELTHGVVQHECNLVYQGQPGALNEHFADVFGVMCHQWHHKQDAASADWLVGAELMGPKMGAQAIRTFKAEKAYKDHPYLGTDPQPKHMGQFYAGPMDHGGVHINSGIPNHAFYLVCQKLGGNSWEKAGPIWYETMKRLKPTSDFWDAAQTTIQVAGQLYGAGSPEQQAVQDAWLSVGVDGPTSNKKPRRGPPAQPIDPNDPSGPAAPDANAPDAPPPGDDDAKPARKSRLGRFGRWLRAPSLS